MWQAVNFHCIWVRQLIKKLLDGVYPFPETDIEEGVGIELMFASLKVGGTKYYYSFSMDQVMSCQIRVTVRYGNVHP